MCRCVCCVMVLTHVADADCRSDSTRLMVVSLATASSDDTAFISSSRLLYTPLWTWRSPSPPSTTLLRPAAHPRCRGVGSVAMLLVLGRRLLFVTVTVAEFRVRRSWMWVHRAVMRLEVCGRWI